MKTLLLVLVVCGAAVATAADIRVFVALADNKTQGIAPVPAKIGDGDDAAHNLYWGCDEALPPLFRASGDWKFIGRDPGSKPAILERLRFLHKTGRWQLIADGYRGSAIRECTVDFFQALASDEPVESLPLVAYLGHDGLMDFGLPEDAIQKARPQAGRHRPLLHERAFLRPPSRESRRPPADHHDAAHVSRRIHPARCPCWLDPR